jgi:hypothetical protein
MKIKISDRLPDWYVQEIVEEITSGLMDAGFFYGANSANGYGNSFTPDAKLSAAADEFHALIKFLMK